MSMVIIRKIMKIGRRVLELFEVTWTLCCRLVVCCIQDGGYQIGNCNGQCFEVKCQLMCAVWLVHMERALGDGVF